MSIYRTIGPLVLYPTAVSGLGSSSTLCTCETSQVLLVGVLGVFFLGFSVFTSPTDLVLAEIILKGT